MAYAEKVFKVRNGVKTKAYTWRARYKKPDGTWGSEPGFPTKTTAERWGEEQEAAIRSGRWIDPDLARKHWGTWVREYMKAKSPRGKTVDTRWRLIDILMPKWEHTPLLSFNWFEVEAWANLLTADETTVDHAVSFLSTTLTAAVDAKHLTVNPLYGRRRTGKSNSANARTKRERRQSDAEDVATPVQVLQVANRQEPARGLHTITLGWLGPRWGESIGLERRHMLVERRERDGTGWWTCPTLRIEQEVAEYDARDEDGQRAGRVLQLEELKNEHSVRNVDVPSFLALLYAYHLDDWPHDVVFSTLSGTLWRNSNWKKGFNPAARGRPARERSRGTPGWPAWTPVMPNMNPRLLRHTADSWQAQIGVAPVLQFEQQGHKYPGIKGTYQHPTPAMRQARLDGLQELFEKAMFALGWRTLWGRVDLRKLRS